MRNLILFTFLIGLLSTSCVTPKWVAPPFTDVGKIINVKQGMTIQQTNKMLGIEPYDMYNIQETGSTILIYHYRAKQRIADLTADFDGNKKTAIYSNEEYQTKGKPYYNNEYSLVYILFEDDKVVSLMTDQGRSDAEYLLLVDNNIKKISKEELTTFKTEIDTSYYTDARVIPLSDTFKKVQKGKSVVLVEKQKNRPRLRAWRIPIYVVTYGIGLIVDYFV